MSGGEACTQKGHRLFWLVTVDHANYSAFNGYHRTYSDYSEVRCTWEMPGRPDHICAIWRTKAAYVDALRRSVNA